VRIADCGELKGDDKLTEATADFLKTYSAPESDKVPEESKLEL
jgi:hypothetical protein